MNMGGFSKNELDYIWQQLISLGPRFLGTPNEVLAQEFILNQLKSTKAKIEEQIFRYQGWHLDKAPELRVTCPSSYSFPCEVFIGCSPTAQNGVRGTISYIGRHRVIGAFDWVKFGIYDMYGNLVAYISGRPGGPAQPQPLNHASAPLPHFIVGEYELALLLSWLERGIEIEIEGKISCVLNESVYSKNIIASFNPTAPTRRILLGAHYDSVYTSPGANDNASSVAVLLAIAKRISDEQNQSPIDLIFFSAEEWDLIGSRAYVAKELLAKQKIGQTKMMLNLDAISEGSSVEFWVGPETFEEQLREIVEKFESQQKWKKTYVFPPPVSSDHTPFYESGIPVCMIFGGETAKYHIIQDTYCQEGLEKILYITELTWYLMNSFDSLDVRWITRK